MNIVLIVLIFIFSLYLFVTSRYDPELESITLYNTIKDNNKTNIECADFKNNNNKDDYYNSSDFNYNNNNNYYNSSDFNNNLLNNQAQQTNSGL